jgi:HK97 family phage prohead protease
MTPVHFTFPLSIEKFENSGREGGGKFLRGHAAVFNRKSHDLGGFRTEIAPNAFAGVLDQNPDVHLVWDHDTRYVLARTTNKTLELREDPYGLHVWASLAPTSYADDLAVLMERGDVDQMSFACDIGSDSWTQVGEGDDAEITRTINSVSGLYDVTVCAQGAFPQTNSALQADLASAMEAGRVQIAQAEGAADPVEDRDTNNVEQDAGIEIVAPNQAGNLIAVKHDVARRLAKFQHGNNKESN